MSSNWCNIDWTPWVSFTDKEGFKIFPNKPGFYRVRALGRDELFYIGQTGRTLRERVRDLIRNSMKDDMPYNDPHTAGPSLWAWRDEEALTFEVSCSTSNMDTRERKGYEDYLLWKYHLEKGESTLCNHGRFHPYYEKSKDRSSGFRGGRLKEGLVNPASSISLKPLVRIGRSKELKWMGLDWINGGDILNLNPKKVPAGKGLYLISGEELLYIGQSKNLRTRLKAHQKKNWGMDEVTFRYYQMPDETFPHQMKEYESNLIGAYYDEKGTIPKYQYFNYR